jgi:hypothetical protein
MKLGRSFPPVEISVYRSIGTPMYFMEFWRNKLQRYWVAEGGITRFERSDLTGWIFTALFF